MYHEINQSLKPQSFLGPFLVLIEAMASAHPQSSYDEDAAEQKAAKMLDKKICRKLMGAIDECTRAQKAARAKKKKDMPMKKLQKPKDKSKVKLATKNKKVKGALKMNEKKQIADTAIAKFKASSACKQMVDDKAKALLAIWQTKCVLEEVQFQVACAHTKLYKTNRSFEGRTILMDFLNLFQKQSSSLMKFQSRLAQMKRGGK